MDEQENPFVSPTDLEDVKPTPHLDAVKPKAKDRYLKYGIACWCSYLASWLPPDPTGLLSLVIIVGMLCGAYVLKSSPVLSPARLHAVIGLLLWAITIVFVNLPW